MALVTSCLISVFIIAWVLCAWMRLSPGVNSIRATARKPTYPTCRLVRHSAQPVKVSAASGPGATLDIVIGRGGTGQTRHSAPLAIQKGRLCPRTVLSTAMSDFVNDNGQLQPGQLASWARVDRYGTHVTVFVSIAPRFLQVTGFGGYSGTVTLNDRRAEGGNVAVNAHVLYPYLNLVLALASLAAFGGFTWAWLIHELHNGPHKHDQLLRNLTLRFAVILVSVVPVVNLQVLSNPDWEGSLSQYVGLGTLVGTAAIAATPTLRALILGPARRPPPS
jgi:hypothetical protein